MIKLYDKSSRLSAKVFTRQYSSSFSLGIQMLHKSLHEPIYSIYGYVRLADEIVDTFYDTPQRKLLKELEVETFLAIERGLSVNPLIHAFQDVVRAYNIDHNLIRAFLKSMEMDLDKTEYSAAQYEQYIYGSAEVVGLMCLKVFCKGEEKQYDNLKYAAKSLGAAFQKVNFLRDIQSDYEERGRVYFPGVDFKNFKETDKQQIEADIEKDFADALSGIKKLPKEAFFGVYVAYNYYYKLFLKIRNTPSSNIMNTRIRIPNSRKLMLSASSYLRYRLNLL